MTNPTSIRSKNCRLGLPEFFLLAVCLSSLYGCSSTKGNVATEQLLMSDAIDRTVSDFDFTPLGGNKVYLDTTYIVPNRNPQQLINTDYVISALRQQMLAAGCQLVSVRDEADVIAEARLGALGTDGQMIIYGVPENSFLSRAAAVLPNAPPVPTIPEIALAKKDHKSAAAKLAVFAYDRKTLEPIWQSGLIQAESTALDTWVLGIGPFRRGTVKESSDLAESRAKLRRPRTFDNLQPDENAIINYDSEWVYSRDPHTNSTMPAVVTAQTTSADEKTKATTASSTSNSSEATVVPTNLNPVTLPASTTVLPAKP